MKKIILTIWVWLARIFNWDLHHKVVITNLENDVFYIRCPICGFSKLYFQDTSRIIKIEPGDPNFSHSGKSSEFIKMSGLAANKFIDRLGPFKEFYK